MSILKDKFPSDKINVTKNALFLFRKLQLITALHVQFLYKLKHKYHLPKNCLWDFPLSIPSRFYQSLYFCSRKSIGSLTLKRRNSLQNRNNRKATDSFTQRPLIFKLQQEV